MESTTKTGRVRNVAGWVAPFVVILLLYATGWHTEVFGRLQQAVLWTGLIQPETELPNDERTLIDYDIPLVSLKGEAVNLSEFKDKVIFLNFWATWCPPCIAEMPNIQQLYEEFKTNDEIAFVMVSVDDNTDKAREFITRKEFTFPVYQLAGRRPASLQSPTIPTTYVIDKSGILLAKRIGMANYSTSSFKSFLKKLLAN